MAIFLFLFKIHHNKNQIVHIKQNRHEFSDVNKISINLTPNACDIFKPKFSDCKY